MFHNRAIQKFSAGIIVSAMVLLVGALPFEAAAADAFQYQGTNGGTMGGSANTVGTAGAIGGTVGCVAQLAFTASMGLISGLAAKGSSGPIGTFPTFDIGSHLQSILSVTTLNTTLGGNTSNDYLNNFLGCVARAIARAALQQMAVSTINWINGGFNGSPSFVTNYHQFFRSVGDQAAGDIITNGTGLAFLCSPFQLQVRIAIAQTYADDYGPQTCWLSQITNNIQGFMNDFSQGGWPAFIAFTSSPANNPFGEYSMVSGRVATAQANAVDLNRLDLTLGQGMLSMTQNKNCVPVDITEDQGALRKDNGQPIDMGGKQAVQIGGVTNYCDVVNTTPGTAIDQALSQAMGSNTQSLVGAKYFDEIINALISQLIQNVLYGGLSNLSSGSGYGYNSYGTIDNSTLTNTITTNLPIYTDGANRVMTIDTTNISALQSALDSLDNLKQCWLDWMATSTGTTTAAGMTVYIQNPLSDAKRLQAQANASSTQVTIDDLTSELSTYQSQFDTASTSLTTLGDYQSAMNAATDPNTQSTILTNFAANARNGLFFDSSSVNNAIEDQTRLNSKLTTDNQSTATGLTQCHAFNNTTTI